MDWQAIVLTLQLAGATTAILLALGLPLAWWFASSKWKGRIVFEALVALPLVLPPTVLGFYVLVLIGPRGPVGRAWETVFDGALPFTFGGILIGSVLYNLPFAVRPFTAAFTAVDPRMVEASYCLGVSRVMTLLRVVIPLARTGILSGMVLTFSHAVGEFGVVLMLGGNIPGVTRTVAVSIYDSVQSLDYETAGQTALLMVAFSFTVLVVTEALQRKTPAR